MSTPSALAGRVIAPFRHARWEAEPFRIMSAKLTIGKVRAAVKTSPEQQLSWNSSIGIATRTMLPASPTARLGEFRQARLLALAERCGRFRLRRDAAPAAHRHQHRYAPDQQQADRCQPQRRGVPFEAWPQQHELTVAGDQEVEHLGVAVAGLEPL